MMAWLDGKKTVVSAVAAAVVGALTQEGVISSETGNTITIILGAMAAIFMRIGINKAQVK